MKIPAKAWAAIGVTAILTIIIYKSVAIEERYKVINKDYGVISRIFDIKAEEPGIHIQKVYFREGGMGAPGELVYKITMQDQDLRRALDKVGAEPIEHGLTKGVFPFEVFFFGEYTQDLEEAYSWTNAIQTKNGLSSLKTWMLVDKTASPTLNIFLKTDPRFIFYI